ncbi:MAG: class I SAM-dependent methyltransferase [Gammaproteobacteria bacterium]|nr:class I SAM-dependent methyltransferase [Gammaproteobacteria bacterium]MBU1507000.1 class I SAM-dependent methyltransferase [Gammaproteobacteria bacterium]MBU2121798.1 class I SAM-dependent methyltransferase [Gammaproteobacteria bacterium]MBU2172817.1 class I SAM-dependent methyltransferase [Gammaproteobacteria bacterium]MBU2200679.1 class I SAM-dependent methyltransferase [Gammaproteobacteria bacterium]
MTTSSTETTLGQRLLAEGLALLSQGDRTSAAQVLARARDERDTLLAAHALIETNDLVGSYSNVMGLDCTISAQDDIFGFFAGHHSSKNPLRDYLADGWRTLSELMLLLEAVDQPLLKTPRVLEFASGHGRFTRHLVKALGAQRVVVSDVVQSAVAFSRATFGVEGFSSASVPEKVEWPARYEVVFVLSLFSHLPRATWSRWLTVLYDAVAPGGLLVLSTHGIKAANFDNVTLDDEGYFFAASSESTAIDEQEYGTTFTSEAFVLARIAETVGADKLVHKAPVHFWNHQDAYVLRKP